MRLASSCSTCRVRKKKCIPLASGPICTLCASKHLQCDLATIKQPQSLSPGANISKHPPLLPQIPAATPEVWATDFGESTASNDILLHPVSNELIDLYFDMVHNKQQILFHRRTFLAERAAGILPDFLVLGVLALMARFSNNKYFRDVERHDRAKPILKRGVALFNVRSELITVQSLQACVLLSFVCSVEGDKDQEALLSAQAVRMTQVLKLSERSDSDPLQREIEIRLFWQVLMMDTWNTIHKSLPRQLASRFMASVPLEEEEYERMGSGSSPSASLNSSAAHQSGIWANIIQLNETYAEIVQMLFGSVQEPSFSFMEESKIRMLASHLDGWLQNLSPSLKNTPENLAMFVAQGRGRELAVLHLIYHHQSQLLYYPYLSKVSAGNTDILDQQTISYAARCKAHAKALSELMWTTNTTPGLECLWSPVNGHLLVVASSVHLHSLLCDEDPFHLSTLKRLLEQNFVMLLQFQEYWPTLKLSISRLQAFHRSCDLRDRQSMFQMDSWMVNFLNIYDVPISNRSISLLDGLESGSGEWNSDLFWPDFGTGDDAWQKEMQSSLSFR